MNRNSLISCASLNTFTPKLTCYAPLYLLGARTPCRKFSSYRGYFSSSQEPRQTSPASPSGVLCDTAGHSNEGVSRIDENIRIKYPERAELPQPIIPQGRGGRHFKRTLAQFSLENRVSVVTGGASGIGLAISQAIIASGSHVAIVDIDSKLLTNPCPCYVKGPYILTVILIRR